MEVLCCQQEGAHRGAQELARGGDARLGLQPSWARSPASPSVAVLEQRAKAWHMAHHKGRAAPTDASSQEEDLPGLKRPRCC